jgi:hypothetical protein
VIIQSQTSLGNALDTSQVQITGIIAKTLLNVSILITNKTVGIQSNASIIFTLANLMTL